jgi:hypothetical protein
MRPICLTNSKAEIWKKSRKIPPHWTADSKTPVDTENNIIILDPFYGDKTTQPTTTKKIWGSASQKKSQKRSSYSDSHEPPVGYLPKSTPEIM